MQAFLVFKSIIFISPAPKAEPIMSKLIDTTVFHKLAPWPV